MPFVLDGCHIGLEVGVLQHLFLTFTVKLAINASPVVDRPLQPDLASLLGFCLSVSGPRR
jgi:hypothetical protein